MTKDTLSETAALRALLSETPDVHVLAEMLGFVADRLMALDVDQLCGAGAHERSADRANHRNVAQRYLFPGVPGATPGGGEGDDRRHSGGLRSRPLNALSR